jgi:putative PIG3 family NAD(P)H quinone oxidoreductase
MNAIDPQHSGGPEVLELVDRPMPAPSAGQLLVRVAAAGVNRPDVMQRLGAYPPPPAAPSILGLEIAGEVAARGAGVTRWQVGDKVCALINGGGYADYALAIADHCLPVPDGLAMIEAAALPETVLTVWSNLFERGGAKAGDRVLVHGGTGGIGTTAILLGKLFGLEVIVTVGGPDKCAKALEIGAAHAIDYKAKDFVEEVARITDKRGVDVILDMIGGDYIPRNIKCLAEEGRHVSIAIQRGPKGEVPIWAVMSKRLVLTGSTLRPRDDTFKAALARTVEEKVWPFVADGRLRPVIDRTYPLAEAADAHRRMDEDHVGKVVLIP